MHEEDLVIENLRLIYHRRHTHQFNGATEISHKIEFHFGWQMTDKEGKNHKQIMRIE